MSIDDATPTDWDKLKSDRYYDNRSFDTKDATCTLVKPLPEPPPEGRFDWGPKGDVVNKPSHYTHGEIECIDAIDAMLGREGSFRHYEATILKYIWRWRYKGGVESLRKARWYLERLIDREVKGG